MPENTDVHIRAETTSDHDAIRALVAAAFGSDAEAALVDRIRASPEYVPELALVADRDGQLVGHVMVSGATLHHDGGTRAIPMLSPLAVDPASQRTGIGAALVDEVVALTERRGEPLVVLEGDPRYYGRFGFEHATHRGITMPLPDWAPSEAGQVRLLASFDPDDASLRGLVEYPAAFDGLD